MESDRSCEGVTAFATPTPSNSHLQPNRIFPGKGHRGALSSRRNVTCALVFVQPVVMDFEAGTIAVVDADVF